MKVREIVHLKTDRPGQEMLGRVVAVNTRGRRVTVHWDTQKITEHESKDLMVYDPYYEN